MNFARHAFVLNSTLNRRCVLKKYARLSRQVSLALQVHCNRPSKPFSGHSGKAGSDQRGDIVRARQLLIENAGGDPFATWSDASREALATVGNSYL
jgi:hypothetical protein